MPPASRRAFAVAHRGFRPRQSDERAGLGRARLSDIGVSPLMGASPPRFCSLALPVSACAQVVFASGFAKSSRAAFRAFSREFLPVKTMVSVIRADRTGRLSSFQNQKIFRACGAPCAIFPRQSTTGWLRVGTLGPNSRAGKSGPFGSYPFHMFTQDY
jgi:hypothetical protein